MLFSRNNMLMYTAVKYEEIKHQRVDYVYDFTIMYIKASGDLRKVYSTSDVTSFTGHDIISSADSTSFQQPSL